MIHFMFITLLPPYVVPTYSYVTNVFVYNLHIAVCARMYSTAQKTMHAQVEQEVLAPQEHASRRKK